MKSKVGLYKSDLLSSKNIGLGSIRVRLCRSNGLFMLNGVGKVTSTGKNISPAFCITIINSTGIEEEVGKVINRDYVEISAGLNQREIEGRNFCATLCNVKERRLPVYNIFPNLIFEFLRQEQRQPEASDKSPEGRICYDILSVIRTCRKRKMPLYDSLEKIASSSDKHLRN